MVSPNEEFDEQTRLELEAAAFRRLITTWTNVKTFKILI